MFQLPPIPSWAGLHPLVIHFPIALLLVAPLFIVLGAILSPRKARPAMTAALLLMILGTAAVFVAAESGEAAGRIAERTPEINAVLSHHEELAERTEVVFSVLTVLFALIVLIPVVLRRASGRIFTTLVPLLFVVLYLAGTVLLSNTAHNGARLVHEFGIRAPLAPSAVQNAVAPTPASDTHESHE